MAFAAIRLCKAGAHQPIPIAGVDVALTWDTVEYNLGVGAYLDPAHPSRIWLPHGLWNGYATYNVVNPKDTEKYYAIGRRNGGPGTQVMFHTTRMSGNQNSVSADCAGDFLSTGDDWFDISALRTEGIDGERLIDGVPHATYCCFHWCGPYTGPRIWPTPGLVTQTMGSPVPNIQAGTYTYFDREKRLDPGRTVSKLGMFSLVAGTYPLKIARQDAPAVHPSTQGSYDVLRSHNIVHTGNGWQDMDIAPFTTPQDGKFHHLGAYTTGVNQSMFDMSARAFYPGDAQGQVSMTEEAATATYYVLGVRATYNL